MTPKQIKAFLESKDWIVEKVVVTKPSKTGIESIAAKGSFNHPVNLRAIRS